MQTQEIQSIIQQNLPNSTVLVSGDDGHHFQAVVISEIFLGKSRVQQQQLVYAALQHHITTGSLHALSLKTYTPEQWQALHPAADNPQ
jgi:acid stress-induced BolA-like protein IbaG/YrbA